MLAAPAKRIDSFVLLTPLLALVAKMIAAASLVVTASVVAERSGPFVAAMIATLPISAGPALVFLALDHDDAFIAGAALGAMATNAVNGVFCLVYAALAQRLDTVRALGLALIAWFAMALPVTGQVFSLAQLLLGSLVLFAALIPFSLRYMKVPMPALAARARFAIPIRALSVAALIGVLTLLSSAIGPAYSGMLVVFPIVLSSLIVILQPRVGGRASAAVMASTLPGLLGFAAALAVVHLASAPLGRFQALALGLLTSFAWNGGLLLLRLVTRRARR